ncbi:MAG: hypothetical protein ABIN95_02550 [Mucilaginibacter sp.]
MKNRLKWLISFGHAFILLALTAFWMNTDYSYGDERLLIQWSSILKRVVFNMDEDPPKNDYLFINLAYEKALIPLDGGLGNEVVTDRAKLAQFFEIVKRHQKEVKFTVCDVFLKGVSENDSLLEANVKGIKNIVFPTHLDNEGKVEKLDINVPLGIADYHMTSGGFLKFRLFQHDSLNTIPVVLYRGIEKQKLRKAYGMYWDNNGPTFNSVIIDYQIRAHELFEQAEYPVVNLSELLILPEDVIVSDFLKNRVVLMGDFKGDVHETIFGPTPGTLILLNVYLTLKDGHNLVSIWWVLFIITGYTVFSRLMLFPESTRKKIPKINWVGPLLGSATYLSVLSVSSYILFNMPVQVLVLILYINLLRYIIRLNQAEWTRDRVKTWLMELHETYFNFK